jgi:hypothetical protein
MCNTGLGSAKIPQFGCVLTASIVILAHSMNRLDYKLGYQLTNMTSSAGLQMITIAFSA